MGDENVLWSRAAALLNEDFGTLAQEGVAARLTTGGLLRRT